MSAAAAPRTVTLGVTAGRKVREIARFAGQTKKEGWKRGRVIPPSETTNQCPKDESGPEVTASD